MSKAKKIRQTATMESDGNGHAHAVAREGLSPTARSGVFLRTLEEIRRTLGG